LVAAFPIRSLECNFFQLPRERRDIALTLLLLEGGGGGGGGGGRRGRKEQTNKPTNKCVES